MPSTETNVLDGLSTSVAVKAPCRVAAVTNITLSGLQTVNGVAVVEGDRVLVTAQTSSINNGIYVASSGQWQRALDFDGQRDAVKGTIILLQNSGIGYQVTSTDPIVFGTTAITLVATDIDSSLRADLADITKGSSLVAIPRSPAEIAAGITPADKTLDPGEPARYSTLAQAASVYAAVTTLARYTGWYRGDRAQHQQLTNCIVGFLAYDDSQMTGTLGYRCTAFGVSTLAANKNSTLAGGSNTAVGYASQFNSVDTSGNTSVGTLTLGVCTGVNSAHNGAFGNSTLEALVSGAQNNAFAYRSMYQLVRGSNNTAMGDITLQGLIAGDLNTVFGAQAGFTKRGGNFLCAFGYEACFSETDALISGISKAASAVVTLSTVSGANPYAANDYVTFSDVGGMTQINQLAGIVTAVGGVSGAWTVTVAIDSSAFSVYTSGGYLAPAGNMGFGVKSLFTSQFASGNSVFGYESMSAAIPGLGNSAFGFQTGRAMVGGAFNALFGWRAGLVISSGTSNSLFGAGAGNAITTGGSNVCAGNNAGNAITNGSNNTSVGTGAGTANGTNRQCFGFNAQCIADNTITLGDTNIIQIRAQVTVITAISDARDKMNFTKPSLGLDFIRALKIHEFDWNRRDGTWAGRHDMGIIAQELQAIEKQFDCKWLGLVTDDDPEHLEATPGKFLMPLVKAVQEQADLIDVLRAELSALKTSRAEAAGCR